jgi:AraC family transcriptional regulator of adaptative response/methylated-DNA-[protein]-cysteine methyltransferase
MQVRIFYAHGRLRPDARRKKLRRASSDRAQPAFATNLPHSTPGPVEIATLAETDDGAQESVEARVGADYDFVMNRLPPPSVLDRAVRERDAEFDGVFFQAVRTTGIFCRPSCPAKATLPKNREYFATARQAIFAGYRPCKRCRPLETDGRPPVWLAPLLAEVDGDPAARISDTDLRGRGIDPARVRRYFGKHYGMTFQAYCRGRRLGEALRKIRKGDGVDDVALGHGYESLSGFRDAFAKTFGQPPGRARAADCVVTTWIESPVGPLLAGARPEGLCLLEFTDRRALETQFTTIRQRFGCPVVPGTHEHLDQLKDELTGYFAGTLRDFKVPLIYPGTPFQQKVWHQLRQIPYGQTISYEALAERIGAPGAQRAVGHANGQNRIVILLPCHRVVNKSGKLGGYGGGLWRKEFLLNLERGAQTVDGPAAAIKRATSIAAR